MSVIYIVKTCNKNIERQKACSKTWLTNVDPLNVFWNGDIDEHDVQRGYVGVAEKFERFILNHHFSEQNWYMFVDDDTYINVNVFESWVLTSLNIKKLLCFGYLLSPCPQPTSLGRAWNNKHAVLQGGAGILMSGRLCLVIQKMIRKVPSRIAKNIQDDELIMKTQCQGKPPCSCLFCADDQWILLQVRQIEKKSNTKIVFDSPVSTIVPSINKKGKNINKKIGSFFPNWQPNRANSFYRENKQLYIDIFLSGKVFTLSNLSPQGMIGLDIMMKKEIKNSKKIHEFLTKYS